MNFIAKLEATRRGLETLGCNLKESYWITSTLLVDKLGKKKFGNSIEMWKLLSFCAKLKNNSANGDK